MPKIHFVAADGGVRTVEAKAGASLMEAALFNNVPGIAAECGGLCSCGTCHVYVDAEWTARLPAPDPVEDDMLGFTAAERRPESRLSCQVKLDDDLDGLTVHLPATQF